VASLFKETAFLSMLATYNQEAWKQVRSAV